ncbi:MAG: class II aldolase/adducin family protein, partial [Candidatus Sumerlaeia bacterium]|nr:class II aldolase/adducin family protein [Candidatus Sumerlaeia bacterium]
MTGATVSKVRTRKDGNSMSDLIALSRHYGSDPSFVIAGGGNTSVKDDTVLHVKASGHSLATITEDGFVALERAPLDALLGTKPENDPSAREERFKNAIMAARVSPEKGARPSVECVIHHLL